MKKGSLAHGKTWFGRRFCCVVIYANLHSLLCICIKMAPTGTFFTFLVIAGLKGEKESLEHGKTWLGKLFCRLLIYSNLQNLPCNGKARFERCFCCLVIYANLHKMPEYTLHGKIKQTWEIGKKDKIACSQRWRQT